jgi:hypothetical protein
MGPIHYGRLPVMNRDGYLAFVASATHNQGVRMVYLQITLKVRADRRGAAGDIYHRYKGPFLSTIAGAKSKDLLLRDDDVQVLHGFDSTEHAAAYLKSGLFERDVVGALAPLLDAPPDVRVYTAA